MISEINSNQYIAAAQFSAAKAEAEKKKKEAEAAGKSGPARMKQKFAEMMSRPEPGVEADSKLPPEIEGKSFDDALSFLLDEVTMAADDLKKNPYTDAFPKYRKKIAQFMHFIVKNCYEVNESVGTVTRRNPNPKKRYIIKIVDDKLDQLAREILFNQADQLNLLAKVDEINGLLVDLIS